MNTRLLPLAMFAVACEFGVLRLTAAPQKPIIDHSFHIDGVAPASTLDDLWKSSEMVIEGVIRSERPADVQINDRGHPITLVYTLYAVDVNAVYKPGAGITAETRLVTVQRTGGVRDKGDHVQRDVEEGFPAFLIGDRYILFLAHLHHDRFAVSDGADAAFLIRDDTIIPRGKGLFARSVVTNPLLFRKMLAEKGLVR